MWDGKPDLVVANYCANSSCTNGSVGVLLANGDGTFQAAVSYGSGGASSVAVADVNGDGKPDLLVASGIEDCDSWMLYLKMDPRLSAFRSDRRFADVQRALSNF
jgi:hypothetical protein